MGNASRREVGRTVIAFAENLSLPDDAATQVYAVMGRRGSGKTYGAGKRAEGVAQ